MTYTITQAAQKAGLTAHTLRFYDKMGLLPFVDRNDTGIRVFKESDFEWLFIINCLKNTGMSLKQIKQYVEWCMAGDSMLKIRLETMKEHKEKIERQMAELEKCMEAVNYKLWYYETAIEAGTERIHDGKPFGVFD